MFLSSRTFPGNGRQKRLFGFFGKGRNFLTESGIIGLDKVIHDHLQVFSPLRQRRQVQSDNVQSEQQVFSEAALTNHSLKIPVRGGYHSNST